MRATLLTLCCAAACQFEPAGLDQPGGADGSAGPTPDAPEAAADAGPPDADPPDAAPDAFACPIDFILDPFGCHRLVATTAAFFAAQDSCETIAGHLVVIDSADENSFLRSSVAGANTFWIGYTDFSSEGVWLTITGLAPAWTGWPPDGSEPNDDWWNEDCGEMRGDGYWNDTNCDNQLPYVCEWP